ncbi:carboxypeptidase M32 [Aureliella helgolandensis]|uniref:Metal-dependent carboxypeptidase n=1 Tax=Aureliella helgolandensis TaxID=2527968 RepID=A0A518GGA2_9BACT|nr:carboxypeptidase M32 [Aureliella helgolandensis]QDV27613.1 Thermostable carboxypeptidase 1 [Aureliella helgolandensis]
MSKPQDVASTDFAHVFAHVRDTALLESTSALLEWDERTGLPAAAGGYRAEQLTYLCGVIHQRKTDSRYGELLATLRQSDLAQDTTSQVGATIARLHKDFQRNTRLPIDLVQAISKATVLGQQAWEKARAANDWAYFQPYMTEIFLLRRREAELLAEEGGSLYDALLDQYEEGARSEQLTAIFANLRDELVRLVQELADAPHRPTGKSWERAVPVAQQREVSRWIAGRIGYSFERGRLDETSHPFCTTLGPDDCRILTRYQAEFFPSGFYGTLHEAGHGMYEQGLLADWYGLPPGMAASLGVHESQSRLWENFVGRSHAFWKWCFPEVAQRVGSAWQGLSAEDVYRDANLVEPSLVRVEADEVTYNLHILIRFEIEQQLMSGTLEVKDAPAAWNERYQHYLGIQPPSDRDGILQDVHWSAGLVGYFPTYSLGNLYAAQLMEAASDRLGDLDGLFEKGEFQPLLEWLQQEVHVQGFCLHPGTLVEKVCGKSLDAQPLVRYLRRKLEPVYGV